MGASKLARPELIRLVVDTIRDVTGIQIAAHQHGQSLFELGLDSIKAIEIINRMEDALDLLIDDTHLRRFTSIDAIADYFEALP